MHHFPDFNVPSRRPDPALTRSLLALACLALSLSPQLSRADVTVGPNNRNFTSITAAVNGSPPDETIVVDPGIYTEPTLTIVGRILRSTQPTQTNGATIQNNGSGAVIEATDCTIEGFTITGGRNTGGHGGGISVGAGEVRLKYLNIIGNHAGSGAGVGGNTGSASVTIQHCIIHMNSATNRGGGVEGVSVRTEISDSDITNNIANNPVLRGSGGGVYIPTSSVGRITGGEISGNRALGRLNGIGGGVYSGGNLIMAGVDVENNLAIDGNTQGLGGGLYLAQGQASVLAGSVTNNRAGLGGGIFLTSSPTVMISSPISGNDATETAPSGGGIFCGKPPKSLTGKVSGNFPDDIVGCVVVPPVGTKRTEADTPQGGEAGDPVSTRTGALYNQFDPDLDLRGPMPLFFTRYYSSAFKQVGIFANLGDNWRHNFDWRLTLIDATIHILDLHGRTIQFAQNGADWDLVGKADIPYQLTENAELYTLLDPRDQRSYVFDNAGLLRSISDGRGNVHTLSYASGAVTQVVDGLGRVLNFTYDDSGNLTSVDDGLGRSVQFSYTDSYLTGVTDLNGETTVYNYSTAHSNLTSWGLFTTMVRPEGNTPFDHRYWFADRRSSVEFDSEGNRTVFRYISETQTSIEDALGNIRTHTHTATGELSGSTDHAGRNIAIGSDATGRRNSITDRMGDVTTMNYHAPSGKLASRTHADGTSSSLSYTARAIGANTVYDLTGITNPDLTTESLEYDAVGNLTAHLDQAGNPTTHTYDAFGQRLTSTNRLGGVFTRTYHADATLASATDPAGNTTDYDYDAFRRLDLTTRADGSTVEYTYDDADRLLTTTDENGNTAIVFYDRNGNVTTLLDPLGQPVSFAYDDNDRLLRISDSMGGIFRQTYDELGRVGTAIDPLGHVTTYEYDIHNRLTSVTDPLGEVWSTTYDLEGVITSQSDPLLNTISFGSDQLGRITEISSPLGHTTRFGYDAVGRLATTTDALGNTTTFTREARGLLSGVTLPGGAISTSYARNAGGQVTDLTDPNGNTWSASYDSSGRTISRTDPLLQVTGIVHDIRNRPSVITRPGGLGTQTYSYDAVGNLTGINYSDGATLAFAYDAADRVTAASSGGGNDVTRSYDSNGRIDNSNGIGISRDMKGRITSMTLAPGKEITYDYDALDRLIGVNDWTAGLVAFSYDAAGRLTEITRPNGVNTGNTWDDASRLTGIDESGVSSILLTRDAKGQVTSATRNVPEAPSAPTGPNRNYSFDAASQINGVTYDAMGRLTARGPDTFSWDLASRLTTYTVGGNAIANTYDALGRRISRTTGGATRDYVWNDALGLSSISVERQGGADLRYYIHSPNGDLLYSIDATTNARRFYHYDEIGNTLFLSDPGGAVIGSYAHTPYGELTASSGGLDNPFTWQGRTGVMDEGNGLYYVRARYYDSGASRFISRDPIEQSGPRSVNPYQYALGNPLLFLDPTGRDPVSEAEEAVSAHQLAVTRLERIIESRASTIKKREDLVVIRFLSTVKDAAHNDDADLTRQKWEIIQAINSDLKEASSELAELREELPKAQARLTGAKTRLATARALQAVAERADQIAPGHSADSVIGDLAKDSFGPPPDPNVLVIDQYPPKRRDAVKDPVNPEKGDKPPKPDKGDKSNKGDEEDEVEPLKIRIGW